MFLPNPTNIRRSNLVGIDDMFVIMQSLDNLGPNERKANNIPQNIGQTMKHAGRNGVKTFLKSRLEISCATNDFKLYKYSENLKQLKFMKVKAMQPNVMLQKKSNLG